LKNIINTEKRNLNSVNIDLVSTIEILRIMNEEDKKVAIAVQKELRNIAKAIDLITESFLNGGSLLYFGAGTSGRLGVLDASECPPTFGVPPEMVRGFIAGGDTALRNAIEGAEDSFEAGKQDFINSKATNNDVAVVISASGNANYILGVLEQAKNTSAKTVAICCNPDAKAGKLCDIFICPVVGEELVTGSSRLKAGTAQKMVLNMLTTASMIKIGKTYENLMVDVKPTNSKLIDRATRIIAEIANVSYEMANDLLKISNNQVKTAIVMHKKNLSYNEAVELLARYNGKLREALKG